MKTGSNNLSQTRKEKSALEKSSFQVLIAAFAPALPPWGAHGALR
jgi:hypothetical protein